MSAIRRWASGLLRAVLRHTPSDSQDWANAMLRELDVIVLGPWMYDRTFQALRSTWIESVARKTLGREGCRGSGIGNRHCSCRDRLCVRSRAQVVLSLPSLGLGANAMVGGHDWDTGSDFHRYRSGPLAEKKIDGRRHSV